MWKSTGRRPMRSPPTSGHERLVVAGEQRAEQQDRDAVEAGELERHVGAGGLDGVDGDAVAVDLDPDAERGEDVGGDADVTHRRGRW